jgi:hypothetical protein
MTSNTKVEQLRTRLERLPQELYDQIYNLTFAFDWDKEDSPDRLIDENYRLPWQLQIDRNRRKEFMEHYYGSTACWRFPKDRTRFLFHPWVRSLSGQAKMLLRNVDLSGRCEIWQGEGSRPSFLVRVPGSDHTSHTLGPIWVAVVEDCYGTAKSSKTPYEDKAAKRFELPATNLHGMAIAEQYLNESRVV